MGLPVSTIIIYRTKVKGDLRYLNAYMHESTKVKKSCDLFQIKVKKITSNLEMTFSFL